MRTGAVVVSYVRSDGHALAAEVRTRLADLGHEVWLDVVDMVPGHGCRRCEVCRDRNWS